MSSFNGTAMSSSLDDKCRCGGIINNAGAAVCNRSHVGNSVGASDNNNSNMVKLLPGIMSATTATGKEGHHLDGTSWESILARHMLNLSLQEREKAYEDIHGITGMDDHLKETPEFLQQCLDTFETQLQKRKDTMKNKTSAYELAEQQNKEYVSNKDFRLMFLRADEFRVDDAVSRFFNFFEFKKLCFGTDKLCKNITYSDLDDIDRDLLDRGIDTVLPLKDNPGRKILVKFPERNTPPYIKRQDDIHLLRIGYYQYMDMVETDVDTQRKGIVKMIILTGKDIETINMTGLRDYKAAIVSCLPFRLAALHVCFESPLLGTIMFLAVRSFVGTWKARIRTHYGSMLEWKYSLMTYGIPVHLFPSHEDNVGEFLKLSKLWIHTKKRKEALELESVAAITTTASVAAASSSSSQQTSLYSENSHNSIHHENQKRANTATPSPPPTSHISSTNLQPGPNDVLLQRGRKTTPGYTLFSELVTRYYKQYENAERLEKVVVAEMVVARIRESGGRFLRASRTSNGEYQWEEVDKDSARTKVTNAFRMFRFSSKP